MRILFVTNRHYLPQAVGGAEWSTHIIAEQLVRRGHDVRVMCCISRKGALGLRNRLVRRVKKTEFPRDKGLGYPVYRGWDPIASFEAVTSEVRPDRIIVIGAAPHAYDLAKVSVELGFPTFYQVRDVEFDKHGGNLSSVSGLKFISNSKFTRDRVKEALGRDSDVILPPIQKDRCKVDGPGHQVLMINPDPSKGGDIALSLAECCSDIPFVIRESWLSNRSLIELKARAEKLRNVSWKPATMDVRKVFRDARVLLSPSRWDEAWGRVVSEAQVSGIPAIASRRGGLPESVGPGGLLVESGSDITVWKDALRSLWDDPETYRRLSDSAYSYSLRPDIQASYQAEQLIRILDTG